MSNLPKTDQKNSSKLFKTNNSFFGAQSTDVNEMRKIPKIGKKLDRFANKIMG